MEAIGREEIQLLIFLNLNSDPGEARLTVLEPLP
jgi:hypothetical protein